MRKIFLLIVLATLSITACKKKNTTTVSGYITDSSFVIAGIKDMSIGYSENKDYELTVSLTGKGEQAKVTLSAEGQPQNATIWFTENNAVPPFTTTLKLENKLAEGGVYPIKIIGTTPSGKKRVYNVNLTVSAVNCSEYMGSRFFTGITCYTKGLTNAPSITRDAYLIGGYLFKFPVRNDYSTGYRQMATLGNGVPVIFDCDKKTIEIPKTTFINKDDFGDVEYTITGSGTITDQGIHIIYHSACKFGTLSYEIDEPYQK